MSQFVQVAGPRRAPRNRGPSFKGIAPGAGATAPLAFGATNGRNKQQFKKKKKNGKSSKNGNGGSRRVDTSCWNAFAPQHLALPRAVGEYTVTRGTTQITSDASLIFVGTWQYGDDSPSASQGYGRNWADVVALTCHDLTKKPSEAAWVTHKSPMLATSMGAHSQLTPSACSVQIMNGNALQTTSGMLYIGKLKIQPNYAQDNVDTGKDIADNFVSYMAPRLCAAAKLALRGIQVDAHPLNMNRLADFTQIYRGFPTMTSSSPAAVWPAGLCSAGFTPIVIYNPDNVNLNLLVCQEYRTRFELFNPACASHKFHPPSTDQTWSSAIKTVTEIGAGALDIADIVARTGLLQRFGPAAAAAA